jgi:hypothetical protein
MHEHYSDRLYVPAIDVIHIRCEHRIREGWYVRLEHRHSGEEWADCPPETYGPLDVGLVLEVTDAALSGLLEWP